MKNPLLPVVLIALLVGSGWYFREPIKQRLDQLLDHQPVPMMAAGNAPAATAAPSGRQQTVYRWVDKNGITHFDQQGGSEKETVVLDPAKVQSLNQYAAGGGSRQTQSPGRH